MDKIQDKSVDEEKIGDTSSTKIGANAIMEAIKQTDRRALACDIVLFALGFVLSRCHILFGARPLGIAFVSMLPIGVWAAVGGAAIGALTLGADGIIFAVGAVISILLRAAVTAGDKDKNGARRLFGESLLTRMAISVLGGFVVAVYRVLTVGLNEGSLAHGLVMVILTPIITFGISGIFGSGITVDMIIDGNAGIFSREGRTRNERYDLIFFQASTLLMAFLIGLSFKEVSILGISLSYIFAAVASIITSGKFGALRGAAIGFAASLSLSAELSVAFALAGLGSGVMMSFGVGYGILIGAVALGAWSSYANGMSGLLSTLPEYLIASAIAMPILKRRPTESVCEEKQTDSDDAEGMVGTMALAYQNRYVGSRDALPEVMRDLALIVDERVGVGGEEYRLFSTLLEEAEARDAEEKRVDSSMTEPLTAMFKEYGFNDGSIRAFGERKKHFILAGEDESGARISSFELRKSIESTAGVRLDTPEYFRRGNMVLMECGIRPKYRVEYAIASSAGSVGEISGDSAICFAPSNDRFYSLISDGMGSGMLAKDTSTLVCDFLKKGMEIGSGGEAIIRLLNRALTLREEECSATVDLMEIDTINGKGIFIKSGAAPSYVKRGQSIFRIRSHTAPIGLLSSIDTEKIRIETNPGDYVIMMSDGIADPGEDAPWLLLLLGEDPPESLDDYAALILAEAEKNAKSTDDMTVVVLRIEQI